MKRTYGVSSLAGAGANVPNEVMDGRLGSDEFEELSWVSGSSGCILLGLFYEQLSHFFVCCVVEWKILVAMVANL